MCIRDSKEGQVAYGEIATYRAPCDVGVGDVVAERTERREQRAPYGTLARKQAIGGEEAIGQFAEARDEEAVEVEDLDLFRCLDAGAHLPQVFELTPLGSPLEVERVVERVEVRLADERRHQRDRQQQDQPRRVHQ